MKFNQSIISGSNPITVTAVNAENLANTKATISCSITGLKTAPSSVTWEKPGSGGVIKYGNEGYLIAEGNWGNECISIAFSKKTVL